MPRSGLGRERRRYEEWEQSAPQDIAGDALWTVEAYRLALFAADLAWRDATRLMKDRRTRTLSDQLYRSTCSISANLAEGYSRGTGRDRARFYEYALGSARESRDWYYKARHVLHDDVVEHRLKLLTQVIRLLLTTIRKQRGHTLREDFAPYASSPDEADAQPAQDLNELLNNVPLA